MSGPNLPDGKDLDSLEFICLDCDLPECDESDAGCKYRQASPKPVEAPERIRMLRRDGNVK